mgnify:CR=1 FL=1
MKLTNARLWRTVDVLNIVLNAAGCESDTVRVALIHRGTTLSIDTIQRDLNHLVSIGLLSRTRCCGDPYWYSLTDMGRRVMAGYTRQED